LDANEREILFEEAVTAYRRGWFASARNSLSRLVEKGSRDPAHLSYYGLLLALTGERSEAISLCENAVAKDGRRASLLYLNLARTLDASGRRRDAIEALKRGLLVHPRDRQLKLALQHLVPRARPVVPFLDRKNGLNRYLGLARSLSGRAWVAMAGRRREPFLPEPRQVPGRPRRAI
jgi:tetratricopeptide (TPR) repeat protein